MAEARKLSFQYVRHGAPESLLTFLLRRFHYHTPEQWLARIESGAVTIDGNAASPQHVLVSRERIVYIPPHVPEPHVDASYKILFEDDWLVAVFKSDNIPTSPSGKYWYNSLRSVLQRELKLPDLHAVHRLDRETSGVNLFAKTHGIAGAMGKIFASGVVEKRYATILKGRLPAKEVLISAPLQHDGGEISIKQAVHPEGRRSETRFSLRAVLPGACLVHVSPRTGRTHQIRVHAAFLGTPVWGDRLYGVTSADFIAWAQNKSRDYAAGHLLHAKSLRFPHPVSGQTVVIDSDEGLVLRKWLERQL